MEIEGAHIPSPTLTFKFIGELKGEKLNATVTVAGIVYEVGKPMNVMVQGAAKANQQVTLVDDSKQAVTVTLWGSHVGKLDDTEGTAVVMENVTTKNFRGKRTLSTGSMTVVRRMEGALLREQKALRTWWCKEGQDEEFDELLLDE